MPGSSLLASIRCILSDTVGRRSLPHTAPKYHQSINHDLLTSFSFPKVEVQFISPSQPVTHYIWFIPDSAKPISVSGFKLRSQQVVSHAGDRFAVGIHWAAWKTHQGTLRFHPRPTFLVRSLVINYICNYAIFLMQLWKIDFANIFP